MDNDLLFVLNGGNDPSWFDPRRGHFRSAISHYLPLLDSAQYSFPVIHYIFIGNSLDDLRDNIPSGISRPLSFINYSSFPHSIPSHVNCLTHVAFRMMSKLVNASFVHIKIFTTCSLLLRTLYFSSASFSAIRLMLKSGHKLWIIVLLRN